MLPLVCAERLSGKGPSCFVVTDNVDFGTPDLHYVYEFDPVTFKYF